MPVTYPNRNVKSLDWSGVLEGVGWAAALRDTMLPPTAFQSPTTVVIDLEGVSPTASALREVVVPLGQRIKGGTYGQVRLVIAARDEGVAEIIDLLALNYELPLFIARSIASEDVTRARPAGNLTSTERGTLNDLIGAGGWSTVSAMSARIGLESSAATNRLVGLERKGYLYRMARNRRAGDIFVDPRADMQTLPFDEIGNASLRSVLIDHGVTVDPYDRTPVDLESDAAERAAEIIQRRRDSGS
jgi:hypothetical protein